MPIQEWSERIWIASLANEPSLSEDLTNLCDRIAKTEYPADLVVDLSSTTQLNSTNLSQLLRIRKVVVDRELRMVLAGPTDAIWAIFLTTGLDKVFEFTTDVATALASLQMRN